MPARRSGRAPLVALLVCLAGGLALLGLLLPGGDSLEPALDAGPRAEQERSADVPVDAPSDSASEDSAPALDERVSLATADTALAKERELVEVTGRVVDLDGGAAIAGALVRLRASDRRRAKATTAEDGTFSLRWPTETSGRLSISHPEYVERQCPGVPDEPSVIELVRRGSIVGRVRAPGARDFDESVAYLFASDERSGERAAHAEVPVDEHGAFRFEGVDPGEYAVAVELGEGPFAYRRGLRLASGEELSIEVDFLSTGSIAGRVAFPDGRPVEGAQLELIPRAAGVSRPAAALATRVAVTAGDGRYVFPDLAVGRCEITVRVPWKDEQRRVFEINHGGDTVVADFRIPAPGSLGGRVVDGAGRPVEGALVLVGDADDVRGMLERKELSGDSPPEGLVFVETCGRVGEFAVERVPAGRDLLVVALPADGSTLLSAHLFAYRDRVRVGPARSRTDLVLELALGYTVRGVVLDAAGDPVVGAKVRYEARIGKGSATVRRTVTDEEGQFALAGVPTGRGRVRASAEGFSSGRYDVAVGSEDPRPIELELDPRHALAGVVIDSAGFGVTNARISAVLLDARTGRPSRTRRNARSKSYGRFELSGLEEGTWRVAARAPGWQDDGLGTRDVSASEAVEVVLELAPEPRPARSAVFGEIVVGAAARSAERISIENLRGGILQRDGDRFRVEGLWPGRVQFAVTAQGCERKKLEPFDLAPGVEHDLGRVVLRPATRLTVRVVDESGAPINGARVELLPAQSAQSGGSTRSGRLRLSGGRGGSYTSQKTPRRAWQLQVQKKGFTRVRRPLEIQARSAQKVRVVLKRS